MRMSERGNEAGGIPAKALMMETPEIAVREIPPVTAKVGNIFDTDQNKQQKEDTPPSVGETTTDNIPSLILNLDYSDGTSASKTEAALKQLVDLSVHGNTQDQIEMIQGDNCRLVPALLEFIKRCGPKSRQKDMALLILNNISIPKENKSRIGIDFEGAKICSKLLCDDPSCHQLAIILFNLAFTDSENRRKLVSANSGIGLVESLAYTFRVASLTHEEYQERVSVIEERCPGIACPGHRLSVLMTEDERIRVKHSIRYIKDFTHKEDSLSDPTRQLIYPETARWCMSALKNLTRPCRDATAAHILVKSGVLSLILSYIEIPENSRAETLDLTMASYTASPRRREEHSEPFASLDDMINIDLSWDARSIRDAALSVVMNLAACALSRDYVYEADAVDILSSIATFPSRKVGDNLEMTHAQKCQQDLYCLKARMALAFLLGSEGHFGQARVASGASTFLDSSTDFSVLIMSEMDCKLLVEMLANTLHHRGRDGPGGYSATTFSLKYVLYAVRCLLTHSLNQKLIEAVSGRQLNTLLVKCLAVYCIEQSKELDSEGAEYACFSLYLQSNYGFKKPFLPLYFKEEEGSGPGAAEKIISTYFHRKEITSAGRHAAEQVLLRLNYMVYEGTPSELAPELGLCSRISDFALSERLQSQLDTISINKRITGAKPRDDIFNRAVFRSRKPKRGVARTRSDDSSLVVLFPNALCAVQQLSYGSTKVRHIHPIDDIMIANNIAKSANGEITEFYNFWWSWEDQVTGVQQSLALEQKADQNKPASIIGAVVGRVGRTSDGEPITIFGLRCGSIFT